MKKWLIIALTIIMVLVVDLTTKHFLFDVEYRVVIPHVISIASNGGNTGAAWGIFSGQTVWLTLASIVLIGVLFVFDHFMKQKNPLYCISFGFIIGGAIGNLTDRVMLGYVRDFLFVEFIPDFPVFNFADSFLCVGAVLMAIFILFDIKKSKK